MANDTGHRSTSTSFASIDYVQLAVYPVILMFGSVGNALAILVVLNKKNRKINDYFILNLAVSDLCMVTISISADFYLKFREFPLGDVLCKGIWPLMTMCLFASVFTLTCMALERWRTIVRPLSPRLTVAQVLWVLACTWVAGMACVSPLTVVAHHEGRTCAESWPVFAMRQAYTASIALFQYVLPLAIISIAYARIGLSLKHRSKFKTTDMRMATSRRAAAKIKRNAENSKINQNLRTIVILFAIFMLPKQVLWLWLDFGDGQEFEYFSDALVFGEFLLYVHSSTNPVVYGTILSEYRTGFRRYLGRIWPCCRDRRIYGAHVCTEPRVGQELSKRQSNSLSVDCRRSSHCSVRQDNVIGPQVVRIPAESAGKTKMPLHG